MIRVSCWFIFLSMLAPLGAQVSPRPTEGLRENTPRVHVLRGATVVTAPGKSIDVATIIVRDGLIEQVGPAGGIQEPADARVWEMSGKTIYAGFVEAWSETEVADPAGEAARHWNPKVRPERLAAGALDGLSDEKVEGLRGLGFTAAQLVPDGGIFRGASCLVSLGGDSAADRLMSRRVAQCVAFEHGGDGYPSSLMGSIALVRQTLYDARWQRDSQLAYLKDPKGGERVEASDSLDALRPVVDGKRRVLFAARDELSYARFLKVADEFDLRRAVLGNGYEYRIADLIKAAAVPVVLPVQFPGAPAVEDPDAALDVSLAELEHWEAAPGNAAALEAAGIPFSISTAKLADAKGEFWKQVRLAVARGLSAQAALAALTTEPARLVGAFGKIGTIAPGKIANLVVADGDLFAPGDAKVHSVWIDGVRFEQEPAREIQLAGKWEVEISGVDGIQHWEIRGSGKSPKVKFGDESFPAKVTERGLFMAFPDAAAIGHGGDGIARLTAEITSDRELSGAGRFPGGEAFVWKGRWLAALAEDEEADEGSAPPQGPGKATADRYPAGAFGVRSIPDESSVVIRDVTIWTSAAAGRLQRADLYVTGGKVAAVGPRLDVPDGTREIRGGEAGWHVTPGLIDCHSHIAISRGVNEGTDAVTVEVRIGDVVDPTDIGIYRQLAGGLTTSNLLHGSANPMGGQNQVIKLRWGSDAEGMKFAGAKPGVKFALGENVKQSNWGDDETTRYPQTRMGVQQIMRDTFLAARDYERDAGGRRNLRLEAALEILNGERIVHIHSYRQDEILMFVRLAEELGFTVGTFQHVLEGYKVADAIAKLGAGGSTFSDWWAYKMEVYDAIPHNGALMQDIGVLTSFNSDDAELATRMNLEAAKAVKYGGMPEEEALKLVTINPAKQLRIDDRVGSLEPGKDADFVIWSGHPMAGRTIAVETWIDGRQYFSRDKYEAELDRVGSERERLVAKALAERIEVEQEDDGGEEKNAGDGRRKLGLRFLFPNTAGGECRSRWRELYHNGRNSHSCSRNGCCNN